MTLHFEKYHGSGNDFILIDNRRKNFQLTKEQVATLCHRHFGVGADGLILIEKHPGLDFEMKYFNADGGIGSMCGNGGRCAVKFAATHRIIRQSAKFAAFDGEHDGIFVGEDVIKLSMLPVEGIKTQDESYILNTGSPHLVKFVEDVAAIDVVNEGKKIRHSPLYSKEGINVNFVAMNGKVIHMRTYERGVEDETLSCGTGTIAAAVACGIRNNEIRRQEYEINSLGGPLKIYFDRKNEDVFEDVWLEGPVAFVFKGTIQV